MSDFTIITFSFLGVVWGALPAAIVVVSARRQARRLGEVAK